MQVREAALAEEAEVEVAAARADAAVDAPAPATGAEPAANGKIGDRPSTDTASPRPRLSIRAGRATDVSSPLSPPFHGAHGTGTAAGSVGSAGSTGSAAGAHSPHIHAASLASTLINAPDLFTHHPHHAMRPSASAIALGSLSPAAPTGGTASAHSAADVRAPARSQSLSKRRASHDNPSQSDDDATPPISGSSEQGGVRRRGRAASSSKR